MYLRYRWTDKAGGRYAIRKIDAGKKEGKDFIQAGKEIERIKEGHTSKTHYFLDLEDDDALVELYTINRILKTITYEYVYEGTGKKAIRRYLTKRDFEKIFDNPKAYENGTAEIPLAPPKKSRRETERERTFVLNGIKECFDNGIGETGREKLFQLLERREAESRELAGRKKAIRAKILKLQRELKEAEKTATAKIEATEKEIVSTAGKWVKDFDKTIRDAMKRMFDDANEIAEGIKAEIWKTQKAGMGEAGRQRLLKMEETGTKRAKELASSYNTAKEVLEKVKGMLERAKPKKANTPVRGFTIKDVMEKKTKLNVVNEGTEKKVFEPQEFIEILTEIMKTEKRRKAKNIRQVGYRAEKNKGVEKRRGRPGKKQPRK